MTPDVRDWLPEGHLAWLVIDAVAAMDLHEFYPAYRAGGRCRPAYEPSMMVALVLQVAYSGRDGRRVRYACVRGQIFHGTNRRTSAHCSTPTTSVLPELALRK